MDRHCASRRGRRSGRDRRVRHRVLPALLNQVGIDTLAADSTCMPPSPPRMVDRPQPRRLGPPRTRPSRYDSSRQPIRPSPLADQPPDLRGPQRARGASGHRAFGSIPTLSAVRVTSASSASFKVRPRSKLSETSVLDVLKHHMERKTGFDPTTLTLARCLRSSTASGQVL